MLITARCFRVTLIGALFLVAFPALAETLSRRVVAIADGDTLTLLTEAREQVRVRLSDIDTPERRQLYGQREREQLSELASGRRAQMVVRDTDRYGRTVGRVWADGIDVDAVMVRGGSAWVYRRYSQNEKLRQARMRQRRHAGACGVFRKRSAPHLGSGGRLSGEAGRRKQAQPAGGGDAKRCHGRA